MLAQIARKLLFLRPRPIPSPDARLPLRTKLANRFIRGAGIEIGGLNFALPVPPGTRVTYVDRFDIEELRRHYPELGGAALAKVDVIDDGERLSTFADESQDFIIANHFLEHAEDPIGAIKTYSRVLKAGGILYLGVPHRQRTFDRDRPPTTWEHLRADHFDGPEHSYETHLHEWAALVDHCQGDALTARMDFLRSTRYSIHFHVWNEWEFWNFLERVIDEFALPFKVEYFADSHEDILCILRRLKG